MSIHYEHHFKNHATEADMIKSYREAKARLWQGKPIPIAKVVEQQPPSPQFTCAPFIPPKPMFVRFTVMPATLVLMAAAMPPRAPTIAEIVTAVSRKFNIPEIDILSERRTRTVVIPRMVAMYLARTVTKKSLPQIGKFIGGRDHTTCLHAARRIACLRAADPELDRTITELEAGFGAIKAEG